MRLVIQVLTVGYENIDLFKLKSSLKKTNYIFSNEIAEGVSLDMIRFGAEAFPKYIPSFQTALFLSGGLSSMLFMFARVIFFSLFNKFKNI